MNTLLTFGAGWLLGLASYTLLFYGLWKWKALMVRRENRRTLEEVKQYMKENGDPFMLDIPDTVDELSKEWE